MSLTEESLLYRLRRALRREGPRGVARIVWQRARASVFESRAYVCYTLVLATGIPELALEPGLHLRRLGETDLALVEQVQGISPAKARRRMQQGNELWAVLQRDRAVFSCWIFRERTPFTPAPGGELVLPAETVSLEESRTSPAARGRGIAPAAWASIARIVAREESKRVMITVVGVENRASRRAVEKAGFRAAAVVRFKRIGPGSRTSVTLLDAQRGSLFASALRS